MTRVSVDRDSVNDEFVIVRKIYCKSGSFLTAGDRVLEIESSKTMKEIATPVAGFVKIVLSEGDEVAVGALLFEVNGASPEAQNEALVSAATTDATNADTASAERALEGERELSLAAADLAKRLGVETQLLPVGWVTTSDVLAAKGATPATRSSVPIPRLDAHLSNLNTPPPAKILFRRERVSLRKRTEARNLSRANSSGTNSMIGVEVVIPGPRLAPPSFLFQDSIADLVVFEVARLVRRFPELNAFYIDERTVGYFEEVNVGISFDAGQNLKVLALSKADTLALSSVQSGIEHLLHLYESGESLEDSILTTSTLTISDLSRSQADFMLPLLNTNQSLIIGITRRKPDLYALHAAFDHRVSEGLQVATMLGELRDRVISHHRPSAGSDLSALGCSLCGQSLQEEGSRGGRGLIRVVLADGSDGRLCWNCFNGW
jgi:pyruvate/2-oxoglutarate dehydrogenase complex dihydrolipoamide acyltransferase (E2) component